MPHVFNTTGPCLVEEHYMISPTRRLSQIRALIDGKHYFVIHAPRQTGKTTLLNNLAWELTAEGHYAATVHSLEDLLHADVEAGLRDLLRDMGRTARLFLPEDCLPPPAEEFDASGASALVAFLSEWSARCPRPLAVFFDEIDSVNSSLLLSLLRQLRKGYTSRPAPFPQSVALVGMRDVRDYRIQIRVDANSLGTASPFNIKEESLMLRNFTEEEVRELLEQHTEETGQIFEPDAQHAIFEQTQGQPWLVNALASQLTTRYDALVPDRSMSVTREKVLEAREILIERRDTHLDSLVARLREEEVQRVIEPILVGEFSVDPTYDDDFTYVRDLGLVAIREGVKAIANPIYQEIIPRVLTFQLQTSIAETPAWYVAEDGTLDMRKLINGFLEFWREHGEVLLRGMSYQEAAPHLVFMAYLQRIVNAGGRITREFAVGTGRADLVVEFGGRRDVIELKLAHAYKSLERGLLQVSRYAKRLGRDVGYLVLFDRESDIPFEDRGEVEEVEQDGVTVVVVRV